MKKSICVYCSSSDTAAAHYFAAAEQLGEEIVRHNCTLIYGGAAIGLMGAVARSVHKQGGHVTGVIPQSLKGYDIAYEKADQLIVTSTMRERKALMEEKADAFVCLPGGFGTLEELLEILSLKQLQLHQKPLVLLNIGAFYDGLITIFERIFAENFAKEMHRQLYYLAADARDAMDYIADYQPPQLTRKWF